MYSETSPQSPKNRQQWLRDCASSRHPSAIDREPCSATIARALLHFPSARRRSSAYERTSAGSCPFESSSLRNASCAQATSFIASHVVCSLVIASALAVGLGYGMAQYDPDSHKVVKQVTRAGAQWVRIGCEEHGESQGHVECEEYLMPLSNFLASWLFSVLVLGVPACLVLGPIGWTAGYTWERLFARAPPAR